MLYEYALDEGHLIPYSTYTHILSQYHNVGTIPFQPILHPLQEAAFHKAPIQSLTRLWRLISLYDKLRCQQNPVNFSHNAFVQWWAYASGNDHQGADLGMITSEGILGNPVNKSRRYLK